MEAHRRNNQLRDDSGEDLPVELYVVGIAQGFGNATLANVFRKYSNVINCFVHKPKPGNDTCYGFVTVSNMIEATQVIQNLDQKPPHMLKIVFAMNNNEHAQKTKLHQDEMTSYNRRLLPHNNNNSGFVSPPLSISSGESQHCSEGSNIRNLLVTVNNSQVKSEISPQIETVVEALQMSTYNEIAVDYYNSSQMSCNGASKFQGTVSNGMGQRALLSSEQKYQSRLITSRSIPTEPCLYCGLQAGIYRCFMCKSWYCNNICQLNDWAKHKIVCNRKEEPNCSYSNTSVNTPNRVLTQIMQHASEGFGTTKVAQSQSLIMNGDSQNNLMRGRGRIDTNEIKTLRQPNIIKEQPKTDQLQKTQNSVVMNGDSQMNLKLRLKFKPPPRALIQNSPSPNPKNILKTKSVPQLTLQVDDEVILSFLISPSKFWLHKTGNSSTLEKIAHILQVNGEILVEESKIDFKPEKGIYCLALFSEDNCWYRAQILETNQKLDALVLFIDFGNSELTSFSNLRMMPDNLTEFANQAIECNLLGIRPIETKDWTPDNILTFDELIKGIPLTVKRANQNSTNQNGYDVTLKDELGNDIVELMAANGLGSQIPIVPLISSSPSCSGNFQPKTCNPPQPKTFNPQHLQVNYLRN